ncbi:MAG: protein kinase [Planctomycetota bacterium]
MSQRDEKPDTDHPQEVSLSHQAVDERSAEEHDTRREAETRAKRASADQSDRTLNDAITLSTEPSVDDTTDWSGQQIGGYQVQEELGRGGMGVVYRALDMQLDREVAIKVMSLAATRDQDATQRLEVEGRAVASLSSANIVPLLEAGTHHGTPYYAFEYVGGGTLKERIVDEPLQPREAAKPRRCWLNWHEQWA